MSGSGKGRAVRIADGKNVAKSGKKMPGVKSLHQRSEFNTKPAFIMVTMHRPLQCS